MVNISLWRRRYSHTYTSSRYVCEPSRSIQVTTRETSRSAPRRDLLAHEPQSTQQKSARAAGKSVRVAGQGTSSVAEPWACVPSGPHPHERSDESVSEAHCRGTCRERLGTYAEPSGTRNESTAAEALRLAELLRLAGLLRHRLPPPVRAMSLSVRSADAASEIRRGSPCTHTCTHAPAPRRDLLKGANENGLRRPMHFSCFSSRGTMSSGRSGFGLALPAGLWADVRAHRVRCGGNVCCVGNMCRCAEN